MTQTAVTPQLHRHPHGITAVDAQYLHPGHAAAHIIADAGRAAFVDVGTNFSVPHLLAALDELSIPRASVDYVLLTHVHLDHAGGAGLLLQSLPKARAFIHPRGAAHLVEPAKLIAGSKLVYGEEPFARLYGEPVPLPAARVHEVADGEQIVLGARTLELIYTPGHALHHYAVVDAAHGSIFAGDTFGVSYRELDTARGAFLTPSTSPTQFDPQQLLGSVDRMLAYQPQSMYLMHFSRVTDVPRLGESMKMQVAAHAAIARAHAADPDPRPGIKADILALWVKLAREHGIAHGESRIAEVLAGDLELNAQGLVAWLQRQKH